MKVLAIDSSSKTATVALVDESGLIGEFSINHLRHSVILMPMMDELLKMAEVKKEEITHIAVCEGPGSFTGLRIGAATAKGLAQSLDVPIVGVSSLDALAYNVGEYNGIICPIIDALRGNVYTAFYKGGSELSRLKDVSLEEVEVVLDIAKVYGEEVLFVGDGTIAYKDTLKSALPDAIFASPINNISRASSVGMMALKKISKGEICTYLDFKPYYIRKPAPLENSK
ncbi:tRNA (adenosine(37)-N6)-threonylcarbamoyltransferase complex dimerization subunit type 1 TsaB [Thermoanaerobacterium sp. R66]|uniref:tRNA (adenosine(37)-N6)-threonylcarbamoyltransferase complex dimerization subunit type 1 TsaB n=1 Tax=Thermoanaerobacterium sp. R66 TaxID=2742479 RepID=UPI0023802287|nr:tRNA (adenosine(37)-N6)-threonylcarbamoyltransferase complex dimerization subunit type 1 TsaB [Thermoanaerobacterium sp. R66]MDE4542504.1 tRNA (adenosine(37)-N6)-threonylcarbamoyltransferase complex dimerization subunit type 1 TsaB [Thermoanaerobacterium sp. R66]